MQTETYKRHERYWCMVSAIGERSVFAYTQDRELVVMRSDAEGLEDARMFDIVEFSPRPWKGPIREGRVAKWFGSFPKVIARGIEGVMRNMALEIEHKGGRDSDAELFSAALSAQTREG